MFITFLSYFMEYCGIGDVIVNSNKLELILNRSFYSYDNPVYDKSSIFCLQPNGSRTTNRRLIYQTLLY